MKVSREHKLVLFEPVHDGPSLWLDLLLVLFKVVREVTIQVKAIGIGPETRYGMSN